LTGALDRIVGNVLAAVNGLHPGLGIVANLKKISMNNIHMVTERIVLEAKRANR
jgi:hypothetical protein